MTAPAGYALVFSEDFSGPSLDMVRWKPTSSADFRGYGAETWDPARVAVADGKLALTATADRHSGEVRLLEGFHYGYFEARLKLPATPGFWPAFWLLSTLAGSYQEIDVAECDSSAPNRIGENLHWGDAANHPAANYSHIGAVDYQAGFHTYGAFYLPDRIEFYVDDVLAHVGAQPAGAIFEAMQVRLSLSIFGEGQAYAASPGPTTVWPGTLAVDWVRVWQAAAVPIDTTSPLIAILSPISGAVVPRKARVTILAAATDNVGVERVEFRVNGALAQTDPAAPYSFELETTGKPNAQYRVEARAYDRAGNYSSAFVTVRTQ